MPKKPENPRFDENFVDVLTKSQTALKGYCYAALGRGHEANEALQRTNLVLWRKCEDWDPDTEFLRWAIRVAKFEVLGVIRDQKRESHRYIFDTDVVEKMVDEMAETTVFEAVSEQTAALESCLSKLIPQHRNILSSYYTRGHSIQEIAEMENRGLSSIKVLLLRLRRGLKRCIEGQLAKGGLS